MRSNAGAKNKYQQKKVAGKSADAEDEGNAEATPLVATFKNKLAIKDIKKNSTYFNVLLHNQMLLQEMPTLKQSMKITF